MFIKFLTQLISLNMNTNTFVARIIWRWYANSHHVLSKISAITQDTASVFITLSESISWTRDLHILSYSYSQKRKSWGITSGERGRIWVGLSFHRQVICRPGTNTNPMKGCSLLLVNYIIAATTIFNTNEFIIVYMA